MAREVIGKKFKSASMKIALIVVSIVFGTVALILTLLFAFIFPNDGALEAFPEIRIIIPSAACGLFLFFTTIFFILYMIEKNIPDDLVVIDGGILVLRGKKEIMLSDIDTVTAQRWVGGYHVQEWGMIAIRTKSGKRFRQQGVDKVDDVAKEINKRLGKL